jgi:hypothetical protein
LQFTFYLVNYLQHLLLAVEYLFSFVSACSTIRTEALEEQVLQVALRTLRSHEGERIEVILLWFFNERREELWRWLDL